MERLSDKCPCNTPDCTHGGQCDYGCEKYAEWVSRIRERLAAYEDTGLTKKMIKVEGFRAFRGTMRISPVSGAAPFELTGDWLYKPDTRCWYGQGRSFGEEICEVVCSTRRDLPEGK